MKKIWKWLLFVLVILLAAGCVFLYRYINRIRYNDGYVNGNTAGNLYNEGYFVKKMVLSTLPTLPTTTVCTP